jgi:hypothetical protein
MVLSSSDDVALEVRSAEITRLCSAIIDDFCGISRPPRTRASSSRHRAATPRTS